MKVTTYELVSLNGKEKGHSLEPVEGLVEVLWEVPERWLRRI